MPLTHRRGGEALDPPQVPRAGVFEDARACFSQKEELYARELKLMRGEAEELKVELAKATSRRKEQDIYLNQLGEMLSRRSGDLGRVRGLLAAANKRGDELEAMLRLRQPRAPGPPMPQTRMVLKNTSAV